MSLKAFTCHASALCVATSAAAFPFGNAEGCAGYLGTSEHTSDTATLAFFDRIVRYESTCPVTARQTLGNGDVRLEVECSGEGSTWQEVYFVSVNENADTLTLYSERAPDYKIELTECAKN